MSNYLDEMNSEIKRRVELIESPDYEEVPKMPKSDVIIAGITCVTSVVVLVVIYLLI